LKGEEKRPEPVSNLEVIIASYGRMAEKLGPSPALKKNEFDFYDLAEAVAIIETGGLAVHNYMVKKGFVPLLPKSRGGYLPTEERRPTPDDVEKRMLEFIEKQLRDDPEGLAKAFQQDAAYNATVESFVTTVQEFAASYSKIPKRKDSHTARVVFERSLTDTVESIGSKLNKKKELRAALGSKEI